MSTVGLAHRGQQPLGEDRHLVTARSRRARRTRPDPGHAAHVRWTSAPVAPTARWYEPDPTVATVAMTPTWPLRVACTSARAPGSTTPITGTGSSSVNSVERRRRRGVAGDHDRLGVEVLDQAPGELAGERPQLVERAVAVRIAAGVADVDDVLVGQQVDHRSGDGQSAEPGVEHADRPVHRPGEANGTDRTRRSSGDRLACRPACSSPPSSRSGAAVLHAGWNFVVKQSVGDRFLALWGQFCIAGVMLALPIVLARPMPARRLDLGGPLGAGPRALRLVPRPGLRPRRFSMVYPVARGGGAALAAVGGIALPRRRLEPARPASPSPSS